MIKGGQDWQEKSKQTSGTKKMFHPPSKTRLEDLWNLWDILWLVTAFPQEKKNMIQSNLQDTVVVIEVKVVEVVVVVMQQGSSHWVLQLAITPTPGKQKGEATSWVMWVKIALKRPRKISDMFILCVYINIKYVYIYIIYKYRLVEENINLCCFHPSEIKPASWNCADLIWVWQGGDLTLKKQHGWLMVDFSSSSLDSEVFQVESG